LIEKELGRGGIGVVYFARDLQLHSRPVVVKLLQDAYGEAWLRKKFLQEIEALSRIEHPGIVGIFDAGEMADGKQYIVMQFVEGISLRKLIQEQGDSIEFSRAAKIVDEIGKALSAAHDRGVLHCDLKPENIMLQKLEENEEAVKLIDFGIAKIRDSMVASPEPTRVAGTISYMAPEQFAGAPSPFTDQFALAVIAYELLTGEKPFQANSFMQIMEQHKNGVRTLPHTLRPDIPADAEAAIVKALSFKSEDRYARARDFSSALAAALTKKNTVHARTRSAETKIDWDHVPAVPPPPPTLQAPLAKPAGSKIGIVLAIAALFILAALGGQNKQSCDRNNNSDF